MQLDTYRYAETRRSGALRVGVTHFLPRGVRKQDYSRRDYFDVWLPLLSPSRDLLQAIHAEEITWAQFIRRYRAEMKRAEPRQVIRLVAAWAQRHPVSLGCFCADPAHCHRTILQQLVVAAAAELPPAPAVPARFASPACSMPEIED